jgi:hypothetical protein
MVNKQMQLLRPAYKIKQIRTRKQRTSCLSTQPNPTQKQMIDTRKEDLKEIFKLFQDISKREITRSKELFENHLSLIKQSEQSQSYESPVIISDEDYFEK